MKKIKKQAAICFDKLYSIFKNEEHLGIMCRDDNTEFGHYLEPKFETIEEALEIIRFRADSYSAKNDKIEFIDHLHTILVKEANSAPNVFTIKTHQLDNVNDWQTTLENIIRRLGNHNLDKIDQEIVYHPECFKDCFNNAKNSKKAIELLSIIKPPAVINGKFVLKQVGVIAAFRDSLENAGILNRVSDKKFAELVVEIASNLYISERTLRNRESKVYKDYRKKFKNLLIDYFN